MAGFNNDLDDVFPTEYGGTNAFLVSLRPLRAWETDDILASTEGHDLFKELHESSLNVSPYYFESFGRESAEKFGELKPSLDMAFAPVEQLFDARMTDASTTSVEKDAVCDEMRLYYSSLFTGMEGYSDGATQFIEAEDRRYQREVDRFGDSEDPFNVEDAKLGLARVNSACCESIRESADRMNEKYHFFELDDLYELENVDIYGVDSSKLGVNYQPGMDLLAQPKTEADFTKIDEEYLNGIVSVSKQGADVDRFVFLGQYADLNQISEPEDDFSKRLRARSNPHAHMEREFRERMEMYGDSVSGQEEVKQDMRKYYGAVFEGLEAHSEAGKELINSTYLDANGKVSALEADDLVYANKGLAYANCYNATWAMESYTKMEDEYHFAEIEDVIQMESRNIYGVKDLSTFVPGNPIKPVVPDYGDNSLTFPQDIPHEWEDKVVPLPGTGRENWQDGIVTLPDRFEPGEQPRRQLTPLPDVPGTGRMEKLQREYVGASGMVAHSGVAGVNSKKLGGLVAGSSGLGATGSAAFGSEHIGAERDEEAKPLDNEALRKRREDLAEGLLSDELKDRLQQKRPHGDYQMEQ